MLIFGSIIIFAVVAGFLTYTLFSQTDREPTLKGEVRTQILEDESYVEIHVSIHNVNPNPALYKITIFINYSEVPYYWSSESILPEGSSRTEVIHVDRQVDIGVVTNVTVFDESAKRIYQADFPIAPKR